MKLHTNNLKLSALLATVLLTVSHYALAAESGGMAKMPGMDMSAKSDAAQTSHATGVVKVVNANNNTITIATEAVPELKWPAMTMAYKVAGTAAVNISAGQKVDFEFSGKGMDVTITKIEPIK